METFLKAFGWILTAAAIILACAAILGTIDYAMNY